MQVSGSSLSSKAFGELADPALIVACQSQQDALRFLTSSLARANGAALLQGPTGSGKTTVVREQLAWTGRDTAVALVDGAHLTPRRLVIDMLSSFGVRVVSQDDEQLLQAANHFVIQETRASRTPVLFVDNADRASPSVLRLVNWFAALDDRGDFALRIILTGKERLSALLQFGSMRGLARRHPATYSLNPLTVRETMVYLRTRLIAAGGENSEKVFPIDACQDLRERTGGWPGRLNARAVEFMARMTELDSARPLPRIIVTRDGETEAIHELAERQYVIGRTEMADIVIEDKYVSKMHAMLQVFANVVVLLDLNSTNGTTVNSTEVQKTILRNNDIIALGEYRLKIENLPAISAEADERIKASDTMTIQSLDDVRRSRARRTVKALRHK